MTPLRQERYHPFITGPIMAVLALWLSLELGPAPQHQALACGLFIFGAVTGVQASRQRRTLHSMRGSKVMDLAQRSGHINEINACLVQSMIAAVAATSVAGAGLLIGGHAVGGPVWAYLSAGALVTGTHMGARNALMMRNIRQRYEEERGNSGRSGTPSATGSG